MNLYSDTLDIKPLRRTSDLPMAAVGEAENHPEAAAIARARIATLPEAYPLVDPTSVPSLPTKDLVTDRITLAHRYHSTAPDVARRELPNKLKPVLMAIGAFALMLLIFKAPVIFTQAGYLLNKPAASPAASAPVVAPANAQSVLTIPKINVSVPIVYEPSVTEADVQKSLERGVIHYGNTPKPGEGGNSVLFGHSSNDWWEPGDYKFVFVLLDKLAPGDRYSIDYQGQHYIYEVTGSRVVEPTDLSVLKPTAQPSMSLITCTPPGTAWKRLVVTAKQIDPDPSQVTSTAATETGATSDPNLPGAAPSFMNQLNNTFSGFWQGFLGLFGAGNKEVSPDSGETPGTLPAIK